MKTHNALLSLSCFVLSSSLARATDPLPANVDGKSWLDGSLRLGFLQSDSDASIWAADSRISALIAVGSGAIALEGGFAIADLDGDTRAVISNLSVGYAFQISPEQRFTPALVLPLASLSDDDLDEALGQAVTHTIAALASGLQEFWMHFPEAFSLVAPLRVDYRLSDDIRMESHAALALIFPSNGDDDLEILLSGETAFLFSVVRIALGAVVIPTLDGDQGRISLALGVRVPVGQGHLHADFKLDLDDPGFFKAGAVPAVTIGFTSPL